MFQLEYLFLFDGSSKTIASEKNLLTILKGNSNFKFPSTNVIVFDGVHYNITVGSIKNNKGRGNKSCLIKISGKDTSEDTLETASSFLKLNEEFIETLREMKHSKINLLMNSSAGYFAKESYEFINQTENKMRKLITIFMSSKVGAEWEAKTIPDEVLGSIKTHDKSEENAELSILFKVDFIQLSGFLFNEYKTLQTDELHRRLKSGAISLEEVKDLYVPRSNWDRFFEDSVGAKSNDIIPKWKKLYALRNKVAHNRYVDFHDFNTVKGLCKALNDIIDKAILSVDDINVTGEQKEGIEKSIMDELNVSDIAYTLVSSNIQRHDWLKKNHWLDFIRHGTENANFDLDWEAKKIINQYIDNVNKIRNTLRDEKDIYTTDENTSGKNVLGPQDKSKSNDHKNNKQDDESNDKDDSGTEGDDPV